MLTHKSRAVCFAAFALSVHSASAQNWTLSPQPTLTIGERETSAEYQFNQIGIVKRLSNGRTLVTMGPDIRYYDAQGKYVAKAGGRGQGPGEFQYIQGLYVLPGDTLLVLNSRSKVWLTGDGKYVRSVVMNLEPLNTGGWFSEGAALLPNGNMMGQQYQQETPEMLLKMKELHRPVLRYAILDFATGKLSPLIVAGGIRQMQITNRNTAIQPFSPHARDAIGTDRVYVGDNDTTFVSMFTFDGKPLGRITVADRATPVTARDLEESRKASLEWAGNDAQRKTEFEAGWSVVPKPKRFPYWGKAIADATGDLWISDPSASARAAVTWSVFDRAGRRVARVAMPVGFAPREIGADYVLGVQRDDLGVETIRSYRLNRSAR